MKNTLFLLFLQFFVVKLMANVLVVEGNFQNKNIYVQNSFGANVSHFTESINSNNAKRDVTSVPLILIIAIKTYPLCYSVPI